jgi:hypothetical protein
MEADGRETCHAQDFDLSRTSIPPEQNRVHSIGARLEALKP